MTSVSEAPSDGQQEPDAEDKDVKLRKTAEGRREDLGQTVREPAVCLCSI